MEDTHTIAKYHILRILNSTCTILKQTYIVVFNW